MTMMGKSLLVGGPLLGERINTSKRETASKALKSWSTFEPIVTRPCSGSEEQFILLPSGAFVAVLAYKTGHRVASFVPLMENEQAKKDGPAIRSACLATFPSTRKQTNSVTDALRQLGNDSSDVDDCDDQHGDCHVLLVGCSDGTIREFDLSALTRKRKGRRESNMNCGDYEIPGPCFRPRRVLSVTDRRSIQHLTAPPDVVLKNDNVLVYALFELKADGKSHPPHVTSFLLRVKLPPYRNDHSEDEVISLHGKEKTDETSVQASIKGVVGYDKKKEYHNTVPFRLLSVSTKGSTRFAERDNAGDRNVVVIVGQATKLHVYYDGIKSGETMGKMRSTTFSADPNNLLSSIGIAPNGTDISCGYTLGDIRIMSDAVPQIVHYFQKLSEGIMGAPHPSKTVLLRRLHWHAHPVMSLAYQRASGAVDPMLYSGGLESVLVTWQVAKGNYRPADVLPRLAKGGIVHICCTNEDGGGAGILVYCEDNSMQLFAAHNKKRLWKVQGLASCKGDSLGDNNARLLPMMRDDSLFGPGNALIMSGLPGAPGCLHWYDIREQRVTAQLEVAPFNRVSRTETDDSPLPVPSVTHCAFSDSGDDLVTVDTIPTENGWVGATERLRDGNMIGVVSTVRFWRRKSLDSERSSKDGPYTLAAAMTYPHGEANRVSAVAICKDGEYACTVSNDENAFRLWRKVLSENPEHSTDADKKSRRTPVWLCQFKVTAPSGYSNFSTGSNAVDFSSDGSLLAVCYGNMITLWDHKEATLLTALQHLEDNRDPVDSLSFVKTNFLWDFILTKSRSGVAMQSPYRGGKNSWSCAFPQDYKDASVSHALLVPSHDLVAVCVTFLKKSQSRILLLDAVTGVSHTLSGADGEREPLSWELPGTIRSIGVHSESRQRSNWVDVNSLPEGPSSEKDTPIRLYVQMSNGNLMLLSDESAFSTATGTSPISTSYSPVGASVDAPRLNMLKRGNGRKRSSQDAGLDVDGRSSSSKKRTVTVGSIFDASHGNDGTEAAPLPSCDLPALGTAFTRAFVSRNLAFNRGQTLGEE